MDILHSADFPQPPAHGGPASINTRTSSRVAQAVQRLSTAHMTPPLTPVTVSTPASASTASAAAAASAAPPPHNRHSQMSTLQECEPGFHSYLRAFYHFHPTSPVSSVSEESSITVPINQGDVILVHSIQPNGWADGTLLTSGARGWLPTNYCEAYDHHVIRNLLSALTNVWEFIRGHEDEGDAAVFAKQDYVRGMIAGVRVFLERARCLNRDSPLVQQHAALRRLRKAILGELSTFVKAARALQDVCHAPIDPDQLYQHLDDIVFKAFRVVTRAVRFLDCWANDVQPRQTPDGVPLLLTTTTTTGAGGMAAAATAAGSDMPLTPPADMLTPQTPSVCNMLSVSGSMRDSMSVAAVTPSEDSVRTADYTSARRTSSLLPDSAPAEQQQQQQQQPQQLRVPSQRLSAAFAPNSLAGQRPSSISSKRTSVAHRWSHHAGGARSSIARSHVLASERLNTSHDSFLGSLGAYIGLHMQSRWSMDLLVTTQHSVTSCQSLLAVVDDVYERDFRRSDALEAAKETMESSLAALVQATRAIFQANDDDADDVFMPDQGRRLVDAATLCVRSAGECVSKTKTVIERIGDFELEPVAALSPTAAARPDDSTVAPAPAAPNSSLQSQAHGPAGAEALAPQPDQEASDIIEQLPLPPLPLPRDDHDHDHDGGNDHESTDDRDASLPPHHPAPSPVASEFSQHADEALVPAPLRTAALRAVSESCVSRSSSETVVAARENSTPTPTPASKYPSLDVEIPSVDHFDLSPSSALVGDVAKATPDRTDSVGADTNSYMSSFRRSEQSMVSQVSTRATTPDQTPDRPDSSDTTSTQQRHQHQQQPSFGSGSNVSDSRDTVADDAEDAEDQFLAKTHAHELIFNKDGQVSGGTLPALVEQLTTHDSTPDAIFVNTFYLTFRLFTTPTDFARALVDRFEFAGDAKDFATPVRLRVYNVFKGWLESHWRPESDTEALRTILHFAQGRLRECLPTASRRLVELAAKVSDSTSRPVAQRLLAAVGKTSLGGNVAALAAAGADGPAPSPIVSKGQLSALRNHKTQCTILDFDALELARQITIIESRIFCAIQPEELLALEWTRKNGSRAPNVKAKSGLSTDLANLVADSILQLEEPKKRALVIKQWVKIAKKCEQLHNYDSLMAIICSLNSSMVTRLRRTWDCVSPKTRAKFDELQKITSVSKNYASLRQRLQHQVAPCLPFVGLYLTDLTFVDVGNQSTRQLSNASGTGPDGSMSVINFDKQVKTARIIGDLQRFQVPYRLAPVPEMQDWMEAQIQRMRESDQADVQHFYRRSQMLEPREACKLAVPKLQASESFPGATKPDSASVREKLDFWNQFHLPSKDKVQN